MTLGFAGAGAEPRFAASPGLSVSTNGVFFREGTPFRGAGVNYYDALVRTLSEPPRPHPEEGFQLLEKHRIPFLRFAAGGYWPVEWGLYRTNRAAHFARLDTLVRSAERHGLGLVPSLFWHLATVPDLVGEPVSAWGLPDSRTLKFMREYTREVVLRYRDSPAIWGWEFGNEYNLPADLPNAAEHRPPVVPALGTPGSRSAADDVTHAQIRTALREFGLEVRRHDPHRAVFSGNAFPRPSAWHLEREHRWDRDTPEQAAAMLTGDNPNPINTLTGRLYSPDDRDRLAAAVTLGLQLGKPLFVGEFGVPRQTTGDPEALLRDQLEAMERAGVSLAALWIYDFDGQAGDWNVTAANDRRHLLEAVAQANARWRGREPSIGNGR